MKLAHFLWYIFVISTYQLILANTISRPTPHPGCYKWIFCLRNRNVGHQKVETTPYVESINKVKSNNQYENPELESATNFEHHQDPIGEIEANHVTESLNAEPLEQSVSEINPSIPNPEPHKEPTRELEVNQVHETEIVEPNENPITEQFKPIKNEFVTSSQDVESTKKPIPKIKLKHLSTDTLLSESGTDKIVKRQLFKNLADSVEFKPTENIIIESSTVQPSNIEPPYISKSARPHDESTRESINLITLYNTELRGEPIEEIESHVTEHSEIEPIEFSAGERKSNNAINSGRTSMVNEEMHNEIFKRPNRVNITGVE